MVVALYAHFSSKNIFGSIAIFHGIKATNLTKPQVNPTLRDEIPCVLLGPWVAKPHAEVGGAVAI